MGIAEIDQYTIAKKLRNVARVGGYSTRDGVMVSGHNSLKVLRVHAGCHLRRGNEIAKHDRQLATLAIDTCRLRSRRRPYARGCRIGGMDCRHETSFLRESGEGLEKSLAIPEGGDSDCLEVFIGQIPKQVELDFLNAKRLCA